MAPRNGVLGLGARRAARRGRESGLSLPEIALAVALLAVVLVIMGEISFSMTSSIDSIVKDVRVDRQITRSMKSLLEEIRLSSTGVMTIDPSNPDHDVLTLQTPDSFDNGSVDWGAVDQQGVWRSGWRARYIVVENQLVRRVLDGFGNISGADVPLVFDVDNASGGVKGFEVSLVGSVINLRIRVRTTFKDGKEYVKELESSVFLKNG